LDGVAITRVNQVWSTDITYIRMAGGFVYLVAVMDWYSRYVLSWALSLTLELPICLEALQAALHHGRPEIFNSDQGSQFTSERFTGELERRGIVVSMDGRGRHRSASCMAPSNWRHPRSYDRQPLPLVEAALLLGSLRRLIRPSDLPPLPRIRSLAYFQPVIAELQQQQLPQGYLDYLRLKFQQAAKTLPNDAQKKTFPDGR
jgi:hypothetical protein